MVGVREVVINGLRHADDAHFIIALHRFGVDLVGSVL
jgi:hypothetical protein